MSEEKTAQAEETTEVVPVGEAAGDVDAAENAAPVEDSVVEDAAADTATEDGSGPAVVFDVLVKPVQHFFDADDQLYLSNQLGEKVCGKLVELGDALVGAGLLKLPEPPPELNLPDVWIDEEIDLGTGDDATPSPGDGSQGEPDAAEDPAVEPVAEPDEPVDEPVAAEDVETEETQSSADPDAEADPPAVEEPAEEPAADEPAADEPAEDVADEDSEADEDPNEVEPEPVEEEPEAEEPVEEPTEEPVESAEPTEEPAADEPAEQEPEEPKRDLRSLKRAGIDEADAERIWDAGLHNITAVRKYLKEDKRLKDLEGVGEVTEERVLKAIE